jgi:Zn-dependent M28 family amino/carboxypeptidase
LSRIQSLSPDLEIIDDLNSTIKIVQSSKSPKGIFFEGSNILVKVPGSEQDDTNAVLFSAHFDSVSVAPGATDNGMGVVGTLQLLE